MRAGGRHALSREEERVGHLAHRDTKDEGRRAEEARTPEHACQGPRELFVGDRNGRRRVHRAMRIGTGQQETRQRDPVGAIDPRPVLSARTERAAHAKLERQEHGFQRAAVALEHESRAHEHDARASRTRLPVRRAPIQARAVPGNRRQRLVRLGDDFLVVRSVKAHGRPADEHRRTHLRKVDGRDEAARRQQPAFGNSGFSSGRPAASGNGFAGQVDHAVGAIKHLGPGSSRSVRLPADLAVARGGLFRAAGEHDDVVAICEQATGPAAGPETRWRRQARTAYGILATSQVDGTEAPEV